MIGMVFQRSGAYMRDEPQLHVLKTKVVIGGGEYGRRVMWPIHCVSHEDCRVLTGSPLCYRPLSWKTGTFFQNYRDAVEAAQKRECERLNEKDAKQLSTPKWKRVRSKLLTITMGEHTMVVENTTRRCSIEATCNNIDFLIKQLKSAE